MNFLAVIDLLVLGTVPLVWCIVFLLWVWRSHVYTLGYNDACREIEEGLHPPAGWEVHTGLWANDDDDDREMPQ